MIFCGFDDFFYFFDICLSIIHRVDPVYADTSSLHPSEPGHLALCKLMYGDFQLSEHLIIAQLTDDMQCEIFVFESVIDEILRRYAFLDECFDFALFVLDLL